MRLLADECVEKSMIEQLRQTAIVVDSITEISPGASDTSIIEMANARNIILLTTDKDFGELVFR